MKTITPISKIYILIYQSKENLDVKILFGKTTLLYDSKIRKISTRSCIGSRIPRSILVLDLLAIEIRNLFLKLTIASNSDLNAK